MPGGGMPGASGATFYSHLALVLLAFCVFPAAQNLLTFCSFPAHFRVFCPTCPSPSGYISTTSVTTG